MVPESQEVMAEPTHLLSKLLESLFLGRPGTPDLMSGQLAKPVTPYWLDAQIEQEVWLMVGLSKRGE